MVKLQKYSIIENFDGAVYNPLLTYRPPEITYGDLTNSDPADDILAYNDGNITSRTMTNNSILNTNVLNNSLNNSNIIANNSSLLSPVSTHNPLLNPNNDISYPSSNTSNRYNVSSNVLPSVSLNTSNNTSNILQSVSLNTSNISSGISTTDKTFNVFDKKDNNLYRLTQILIGFSILFIVIFLIYVIYMLFFHKEDGDDYIKSRYNYFEDDFNSKKSFKYVPRNTPSFIKQTPYIPIVKETSDNLTKIPIEKEVMVSNDGNDSDTNSNGFLSRFFGFDKTTSSMEPTSVSKQSSSLTSLKDELPSELYLKDTVVVDNSPLTNKTPEKGFLNRFFGTSPPAEKPLNN